MPYDGIIRCAGCHLAGPLSTQVAHLHEQAERAGFTYDGQGWHCTACLERDPECRPDA